MSQQHIEPAEAPDTPLERIVAACPPSVRQVISVFRFEARRTQTAPRLAIWWVLVLFPVGIMALFRIGAGLLPEVVWGMTLYVLIPQVVCLLGLLLWVASLLQSELEGRTWIYFAVVPRGKLAILLGKYINGVYWTGSAGIAGLTLAMLVGAPDVGEPLRLYGVLCLLILASCIAYGSVLALIGTLFPQRAMVVAVAYTLVFEILVSNIPAIVNQVTVQHRLFNILFRTMDWRIPSEAVIQLSTSSVWMHLLVLSGYTVACLSLAGLALRWKEYVTSEQS